LGKLAAYIKIEMIQVSISEIKNRLSHYLKLVRGGEEIEILDRKTPLARIVHISKAKRDETGHPLDQRNGAARHSRAPQKKGISSRVLG
jgi:prevent-host-death family protein